MIPEKIGRYEIQSELGRGGMAVVYKANDPRFERMVAIKVLPREFMHDPQFIGRFNREAKTIAALDHPAIVPVFDYGEQDGQPFLVMRYMPGGSLADRLEKGPLPLEQATIIIQRLSSALNRAHSQGIVHRDLKPNNVLFDQYDDAYLADFGIAHISSSSGSSALTASGSMLGTPTYMSPEQIHGEAQIDGRSDVYALGVIFFQMLTGSVPYIGETATKILMMHIMDPVPDLRRIRPDLPNECQDIVVKAMAKKPQERFATADEMASAVTVINDRVRFSEYSSGVKPSGVTGVPSSATGVRPPTPYPSSTASVPGSRPQTPPPPPPFSGISAHPSTPAPRPLTTPVPTAPSETSTGGRSMWVWLALGGLLFFCFGGIVLVFLLRGLRDGADETTATRVEPSPTVAEVVDTEATNAAAVTATFIANQNAQATAQSGTATALFRPTITPPPTRTPPPSRTPAPTPEPGETATIAAADTPDTSAINLPPIFGPDAGDLPHENDDFIETYYVDTDQSNFIMQTTFTVPFTALDGIWDIGFIFRQTEGDDAMRLVVQSSGYWSVNNRIGSEDNFVVEGDVRQYLNLRTDQTNTMTLIAQGERGYFLLNNNFVSVLDLSANLNAGDVALGTGFYTEDEHEGAITSFSNFYIWSQEPDFGPAEGLLEHVDDGFIESYDSGVFLTNFVADALFTNPYVATEDLSWDIGFSFRGLENGDQYWVIADSTTYWGLVDRTDEEDNFIAEGNTNLLNLGDGEQNRLTLIAWNGLGYFLVNDQLIETLDISSRVASGDVSVITAFFIENEQPGEITGYTDFTVWPLP